MANDPPGRLVDSDLDDGLSVPLELPPVDPVIREMGEPVGQEQCPYLRDVGRGIVSDVNVHLYRI
jgi:hypothetical protein